MGNFYLVTKDPIFYGHHTNVDRPWRVEDSRYDKQYGPKQRRLVKLHSFLLWQEQEARDCEHRSLRGHQEPVVRLRTGGHHTVEGFPAYHARVHLTVVARSSSTEAVNIVFPNSQYRLIRLSKFWSRGRVSQWVRKQRRRWPRYWCWKG